jgi:hypothetical protein
VYLALPLLAATFAGVVLVPVDMRLAGLAAVLAGIAVALLLGRSAVRIEVADGELWVGAAHVPCSLVARVDPLDAEQSRHGLGPGLDARAFVCTRPWIKTHVRVHLQDPRDPVPYWLVATRHPAALASAVAAAGSGPETGQAAHSEQTS